MAIPFEGTVIGADGKRYANNDPNIPDEQIRAYGMALRVYRKIIGRRSTGNHGPPVRGEQVELIRGGHGTGSEGSVSENEEHADRSALVPHGGLEPPPEHRAPGAAQPGECAGDRVHPLAGRVVAPERDALAVESGGSTVATTARAITAASATRARDRSRGMVGS